MKELFYRCPLDKFSISDCKILWDKRTRIPKRDKAAIKADLKTMSNIIEEAMTYTKYKRLKENRETVVQFWLNTKTQDSYYVEIHYDLSYNAWLFGIENADAKKSVGEITSEKWPFLQLLLDEDVETEAVNVRPKDNQTNCNSYMCDGLKNERTQYERF